MKISLFFHIFHQSQSDKRVMIQVEFEKKSHQKV